MLDYDALCRHPDAFPALTGMTPDEFDNRLAAFQAAAAASRDGRATRRGQPRAMPPAPAIPTATTTATASSWPSSGSASIPPTNCSASSSACTSATPSSTSATPSPPSTPSMTSPSTAPAATARNSARLPRSWPRSPQVRVVIDSKEQRVNRPRGYDAQKPYYSGKKKAHTVKMQVVGRSVRADRVGQRLGAGRGQPRPAAAVRVGGAGAVGRGRGGDDGQGVRRGEELTTRACR